MYKKRREQNDEHQRLDDEKSFLAGGRNPDALPVHATPTNGGNVARNATFGSEMQSIPPSRAIAPRLSLRAVSEFEPGLAPESTARAPGLPSNATDAITTAAVAGAAAAAAGTVAASGSTQHTANSSANAIATANDPENPFGNHAEKLGSSPPQDVPLPASPTDDSSAKYAKAVEAADFPLPDTTPGTPKTSAANKAEVAGSAAAGAAAIAAATAAAASNKPQGSATPTGPGSDSVHRVQLDFKPSMEDELEIHAGECVRVLHEYDDGWVSLHA
jgi:hypothetical protein